MLLDVDLETHYNEQWEKNVFNDRVLACKSTPQRDIWKAVYMNHIGEVRRLRCYCSTSPSYCKSNYLSATYRSCNKSRHKEYGLWLLLLSIMCIVCFSLIRYSFFYVFFFYVHHAI